MIYKTNRKEKKILQMVIAFEKNFSKDGLIVNKKVANRSTRQPIDKEGLRKLLEKIID